MRWIVAHQGWYFFPILLLEGASLHYDGIRRVVGRGRVQRRWVELTFLAVRLGGLVALVFLVLPPEKALAFLAVELAMFGLYMGSSFAPNHIGMPLVSPKLKLDFLRRQVLMSRNISGGWPVSIFMGGLNYQIEHHLFPSMARPHLRKAQPLVSAYCAANGVPYTRTEPVAGLPNRHQLPEQRRAPRQRPLPLPPRRATPSSVAQTSRPPTLLGSSQRLQLSASIGRGALDGAWWPYSRDLAVEAVDLVDHFPAGFDRICHLAYSTRTGMWAAEGSPPPKASSGSVRSLTTTPTG